MANEHNLTPWQPGQSGNPKGRPPGRSVKTFRKLLLDKIDEKPELADELVRIVFDRAMKGEFQYFKFVWEAIDGPVGTQAREPVDWSEINLDCDTVRPCHEVALSVKTVTEQ